MYGDVACLQAQKEREMRVHIALERTEGGVHRFIEWGVATSRKGPGDRTGASYAFDIYDFANGTYHYII